MVQSTLRVLPGKAIFQAVPPNLETVLMEVTPNGKGQLQARLCIQLQKVNSKRGQGARKMIKQCDRREGQKGEPRRSEKRRAMGSSRERCTCLKEQQLQRPWGRDWLGLLKVETGNQCGLITSEKRENEGQETGKRRQAEAQFTRAPQPL